MNVTGDLVKEGKFEVVPRLVQDQPYIFQNGIPNVRKLIELPYHQIKGRLVDRFHTTLFSLQFIHAKIKAGLMAQLLEDYALAVSELPGLADTTIIQRLEHFQVFIKKHVSTPSSSHFFINH